MKINIILLIVYLIGLFGIGVMKKLQPENKIYPVWVVVVCVVLTCFVRWYLSLGQVY